MRYRVRQKILGTAAGTLIILLTAAVMLLSKPGLYPAHIFPKEKVESFITPNTTRIYGTDPIETAVAISQAAYPSTYDDNKPNAVILVRPDRQEEALLAAGVIHHPIDGPILYAERERIPAIILDEIKRLDPEGVFQDGNVQVIAIGDFEEGPVKKQLDELGFKYRFIRATNPFDLSAKVDDYISAIQGNHRDAVAVAPLYHLEYALPAAFWNAHRGDGLAYVWGDTIPSPTRKILKSRYGGAYIYLMGPEEIISPSLAIKLSSCGHVQRIPGDNPYALSVAYAGFKDVGRNQGWWIGRSTRDYGWGISEAGHNFVFVNPREWQHALPAAVLSHKGKHSPVLFVHQDSIPLEVENFLKSVKPSTTAPGQQLTNHGWIIGGPDIISPQVQYRLDNLLSAE